MARFVALEDDEITTNELPKSEDRELPKGKRFVPLIDQPRKGKIGEGEQLLNFTDAAKYILSGAEEIPAQLLRGGAEGLGTFGDILDLFDLQSETIGRVPSSEDIGKAVEEIGGPGEAKSGYGRYANRIAKFASSTAIAGPLKHVGTAVKAAFAGQTLAEAGAPAWMQAAVEIATSLKGSKSKTPITSKDPDVKQTIAHLKKIGYSDEDVTLAKNALEEHGWLRKTSKLTNQAEQKFKNSLKNAEQGIEEILEGSFPGLSAQGSAPFRQKAESLFDALDDLSKNVVVKNPDSFVNNTQKAIDRLKKTLANTPQEKEVVKILEEAIQKVKTGGGNLTADEFTRFYKGLNQIGKWGSPKEREYVFKTVKDSIKQTFKDQGPEGQKLAQALEDANSSWIKYLQAEDVTDLMKKAVVDEGLNFKKLGRLLDNHDNYETMVKGLGKEQASNLKLISKTADSIADLEKSIRGGHFKEALGAGKTYALVKALLTGDVGALKAFIGAESIGRISTQLLTNPKLQNITLKMLNAIKSESWNSVRLLAQTLEKELDVKTDRSQRNTKR